MTLKRRFFSAPTLTQALLLAARHHGVDPDDLAYQEVDKRQGFIKTPRGVAIEVDPEAPTRSGGAESAAPDGAARTAADTPAPAAEESAAPPPAPPAATADESGPAAAAESNLAPVGRAAPTADREVPFVPAPVDEPSEHPGLASVAAEEEAPGSPAGEVEADAAPATGASEEPGAAPALVIDDALREAIAEAVDELACLAALRVQVSRVASHDDSLAVELEGPDGGRLVARGGRALLAMQHLLPRLLFARLGRALHCHLDCAGFHSTRSARLEELARKAADRVRRGGRPWLLEPMAPDERRLIHLALAEAPDVETESVGEGFLKRVRVARVDTELAEGS